MNLISQKEFKGDALESLTGVMILSSIHYWQTGGPFTIHESLYFRESVSESCMIQLIYVCIVPGFIQMVHVSSFTFFCDI